MESLLAPGAPLFGRADYRPLLEPLDFRDASLFGSRRLSSEGKLRRYAVLGGTPQYQVWAGREPLARTIADRVLAKGESLYEEPLHLLREEQEIRDPGTYFAIVREVARRASYRLTDPFFRFWFRFVFPNRSLLERGRTDDVLRIVERDLDVYMGQAYEDICREWVGRFAGSS